MPALRRALLLFNPVSGSGFHHRAALIERVAAVFRHAGVAVQTEATKGPGSAGEQARAAIRAGYDAILACGGDGTVFDVLQGVAETPVTMGVIPLGTGNVLAHDLGLSRRPERAAAQLLNYRPQRISLGRVVLNGRARWFTVASGVGVQAELLYQATAGAKQAGGFWAYYTHGARLLFGHPLVPFPVEITLTDGSVIQTHALELMALRVRSFGGPLRYWRPGSSLLSPHLRVCLLRNAGRMHIAGYVLKALAGIAPYDALEAKPVEARNGFCFVNAQRVVCHSPALSRRVKNSVAGGELRVQADGELLGQTPAEISIVPDALTLLVPPTAEWVSASL